MAGVEKWVRYDKRTFREDKERKLDTVANANLNILVEDKRHLIIENLPCCTCLAVETPYISSRKRTNRLTICRAFLNL